MIEVSKLLLLVLGELLLVGLVVSVIIVFKAISKHQSDLGSVKKLVARIKEDSDRRASETRNILKQHYGLDEVDLEPTVRKIAREEKVFYQNLINVYLKRNADALQNLCVDYESSVEPYRTLKLNMPEAGPFKAEADSEDSEEYQLLRDENERLAEELKKTMDTMSTMLNEYSLMFSGEASVDLDREKLKELAELTQANESEDEDATASETPAADGETPMAQEVVESAEEPPAEALPDEIVAEAEAIGDDEHLKALDEALDQLDLSEEEATPEAEADLDKTQVLPVEEDDEVVDLDDVLEDMDDTGQEKT